MRFRKNLGDLSELKQSILEIGQLLNILDYTVQLILE